MQLFDLTLSGIWLKFPLARCCMEGIDITLGFWLFLQRQPNLEKNNLWFLCSICYWYQTFFVICWRSLKIGLWLLLQSHMSREKRLRLEGHRPLIFLRKNNVWCLCSICYWYQTLITFYWWLDWTWQDCSWSVALSAVLPGYRTELKYRLSHRTPQICQK